MSTPFGVDTNTLLRLPGVDGVAERLLPDRTTVWIFENRIGEAGAKALFDGVSAQLLKKGFIARGGQIIDATLVPAPTQHSTRGERELIDQSTMPPTGAIRLPIAKPG